jgi:ribosomal protein L37AE/L43A
VRLHPTQSEPYACPTRFRVVVAGRRWGKTTLGKATQFDWACRRGYRGARFAYIAPTYREGRRTFWNDFKASIPRGWATSINESRLEITYRNGAEFYLLGADKPDSLRGPGWDGLHLDEYATMKPEAWTEVLRPALADRKGAALFTGTPQSFNHFHDLYERGLSDSERDWQSFHYRTLDAQAICEACDRPVSRDDQGDWQCASCGPTTPIGHIEESEIEAAKRDLDERTFRQEFEASFEALTGRIYYAFDRHHNSGTVMLPKDATACISFDFNIDPATATIGYRDGERAFVWREVFLKHRGGEATSATARRVRELLTEAGHVGPVRLYGDATGKSGKTTGPSDHVVIRTEFPNATWCIPNDQPHTKDRYSAVNSRCCTVTGDRRLLVDDSCTRLIADLEQVIFDDKGVEDQKSNPMLTHVSAALGYWLVRDFPPKRMSRVGLAHVEQFL